MLVVMKAQATAEEIQAVCDHIEFMPFMNQPPGSLLSSAAVQTYGRAIHALRKFTQASLNKIPAWRRQPVLTGKAG